MHLQDVLIVEDIVDTGSTMMKLMDLLATYKPARVRVARSVYACARSIYVNDVYIHVPINVCIIYDYVCVYVCMYVCSFVCK